LESRLADEFTVWFAQPDPLKMVSGNLGNQNTARFPNPAIAVFNRHWPHLDLDPVLVRQERIADTLLVQELMARFAQAQQVFQRLIEETVVCPMMDFIDQILAASLTDIVAS
jgi:hypothetical protein